MRKTTIAEGKIFDALNTLVDGKATVALVAIYQPKKVLFIDQHQPLTCPIRKYDEYRKIILRDGTIAWRLTTQNK